MKGIGRSHSVRETEPRMGFEEDEILQFMRKLAEHGVVATLSADGVAESRIDTARWTFQALGPGVAARGATVDACLDVALPPLRDVGLPVGAGTTRAREGIGVLVLEQSPAGRGRPAGDCLACALCAASKTRHLCRRSFSIRGASQSGPEVRDPW